MNEITKFDVCALKMVIDFKNKNDKLSSIQRIM